MGFSCLLMGQKFHIIFIAYPLSHSCLLLTFGFIFDDMIFKKIEFYKDRMNLILDDGALYCH